MAQILKTFIAGHISEVDVDWSSSHEECRTEQQQSSQLRALKEAGAKQTVRTVVENVERRGVFFWAQEKSESIRYQFIDKQVGFFYLFEIIHGQFEEFCHTSGSSKPPFKLSKITLKTGILVNTWA